jgi:hypothetical protein
MLNIIGAMIRRRAAEWVCAERPRSSATPNALQESQIFVPSTVIEYLGIKANFADAALRAGLS